MIENTDDLVELSLAYERAVGVPPLIRINGKAPLDDDWPRGPRLDPALWRSKLEGHAGGNVGALTGALSTGGYLVIFDVDVRVDGARDSIERLHELGLPRITPTTETGGGGEHLWYRSPVPIRKGPLRDFPGVDVQAEGAQVVVPYSVHPDTGVVYAFAYGYAVDELALASLPQSIIELCDRGGSVERGDRPFDARTLITVQLLVRHFGAHDERYRGAVVELTRPGKQHGNSGTVGALDEPDAFYCFTSSWAPFERDHAYSFAELRRLAGQPSPSSKLADVIPIARKGSLDLVRIADVPIEHTAWLWSWRVARGTLTMLEGNPSIGKSTLALTLAALVSRGGVTPDGEGITRGVVLVLTAEDDIARTVRPRLEAAGADLGNVLALRGRFVEYDGEPYTASITLPADLVDIERVIVEYHVVLVVIDVLNAYVRMKGDTYRDSDMRAELLAPLASMAERTSAAVLALRHLSKSHGSNELFAGMGSIAITAAARTVLLAARDPEDEARRVLAVAKSNLAPIASALTYSLVPAEGFDCARVQWEGETPLTASELLTASLRGREPDADGGKLSACVEYLATVLDDGPVRARDVDAGASLSGDWSHATMKRARSQLGVIAERVIADNGRTSHWVLRLPTVAIPAAHAAREPLDGEPLGEPSNDAERAADDAPVSHELEPEPLDDNTNTERDT